MTRVLIVEDDPQTREFFEHSLARSSELVLAGSVGTVHDALQWLTTQTLDVLLTDLGLPDGSGLSVIRRARELHPGCEALVISMFGDEDNVLASIEAGALGYIHKDLTMDDVARTILDMRAGASPISPMIARRLLTRFQTDTRAARDTPARGESYAQRGSDKRSDVDSDLTSPLTPREQEVLVMISRGYTYAEIARLQSVTVHTVQSHIKRLYHKLSVNSKTEAVFEATRLGLLER